MAAYVIMTFVIRTLYQQKVILGSYIWKVNIPKCANCHHNIFGSNTESNHRHVQLELGGCELGNFRQFIPIFPEIFIENFPPVQTLQITVYLLTSSLSVGFKSTSGLEQCTNSNIKTLILWLIVLVAVACMVSLRSTLVPRLWGNIYYQGNFLLILNFRKIYNPSWSCDHQLDPVNFHD